MSEAELERAVRHQLRMLRGVLGYHTYDARRSPAGFPDWVIVGPNGILFRELKGEQTRVSRQQLQWLAALAKVGQDVAVWRPADLYSGRIAAELAGLAVSARECQP
jgi:VRR-NUC domain